MDNIALTTLVFGVLGLSGPVATQFWPTCTALGAVPDPANSANYFVCMWNPVLGGFVSYPQTCPFPQQFSMESQACSTAAPRQCNKYNVACVTDNSYKVCVDGVVYPGAASTCPAGMICDENCDLPCSRTSCPSSECMAAGTFGVPGNCYAYKWCIQTGPLQFISLLEQCPGSSRFDVTKKQCTLASPVACA